MEWRRLSHGKQTQALSYYIVCVSLSNWTVQQEYRNSTQFHCCWKQVVHCVEMFVIITFVGPVCASLLFFFVKNFFLCWNVIKWIQENACYPDVLDYFNVTWNSPQFEPNKKCSLSTLWKKKTSISKPHFDSIQMNCKSSICATDKRNVMKCGKQMWCAKYAEL